VDMENDVESTVSWIDKKINEQVSSSPLSAVREKINIIETYRQQERELDTF